MRRFLLLAPLVFLVATGCIRPHPKTPAAPSTLEVPPPPPRVIVPPEPEQPPDDQAATEPEVKDRRPPRPRPAARPETRPEPPKPADVKPEVPAADTARPPAAPPVPLGALQPQLPASPSEMERQVRDQLSQASGDLKKVDYRALNPDGRSQYETAKRFIEQAGQALQDKNLVFAQRLAEKAVGLASNLVGR